MNTNPNSSFDDDILIVGERSSRHAMEECHTCSFGTPPVSRPRTGSGAMTSTDRPVFREMQNVTTLAVNHSAGDEEEGVAHGVE